MLDIHIENPEIEKSIRQTYGDDAQAIAKAFFEFIQQQKIKQDIGLSIKQLDAGESVSLKDVMQGKYLCIIILTKINAIIIAPLL